jgi:hypothetical protein
VGEGGKGGKDAHKHAEARFLDGRRVLSTLCRKMCEPTAAGQEPGIRSAGQAGQAGQAYRPPVRIYLGPLSGPRYYMSVYNSRKDLHNLKRYSHEMKPIKR